MDYSLRFTDANMPSKSAVITTRKTAMISIALYKDNEAPDGEARCLISISVPDVDDAAAAVRDSIESLANYTMI